MGWNPIKDIKKAAKNVTKAVEKAVNDTGKTIEKAVNDTGNYLTKDLINDLNKGLEIAGNVDYYYSGTSFITWFDKHILNNNLDIYTGGLVSDLDNSHRGKIVGDIGRKESVEDNIKSTARVGAVVGATILTGGSATAGLTMTAATAGKASEKEWGQIVGGIASGAGAVAGGIGKTIGDTVNNIFNPKDEVVNAWTNDSGQYISGLIPQDDSKKKVLIVGLFVGLTLLTVAVATTKKKRKK